MFVPELLTELPKKSNSGPSVTYYNVKLLYRIINNNYLEISDVFLYTLCDHIVRNNCSLEGSSVPTPFRLLIATDIDSLLIIKLSETVSLYGNALPIFSSDREP